MDPKPKEVKIENSHREEDVFTTKTFPDGTKINYHNGKVDLIELPDGTQEKYYTSGKNAGGLAERRTPDGNFGQYNENDGQLRYLFNSQGESLPLENATPEMLAEPALNKYRE